MNLSAVTVRCVFLYFHIYSVRSQRDVPSSADITELCEKLLENKFKGDSEETGTEQAAT